MNSKISDDFAQQMTQFLPKELHSRYYPGK